MRAFITGMIVATALFTASTNALSAEAQTATNQEIGSVLEEFGVTSQDTELISQQSVIPQTAAKCCKYCRKGKACGNSCISRSYTCHKPPGCACNSN